MENAGKAVADARGAPGRPRRRDRGPVRARQQRRRRLRRGPSAERAGLRRSALAPARRARALKGDAAEMARRWGGATACFARCAQGTHLVIDALFGAGLVAALDGVAAEIGRGHQRRRPAGASPSTCRAASTARRAMAAGPVVQATRTVTFFRLKPAHLLLPGRALCGEVIVADIGIPGPRARRCRARDVRQRSRAVARRRIPGRASTRHKYTRGHAVVVSGPPIHRRGPPRRARRAARRRRARHRRRSPSACAVNATHLTAIMVASSIAAARSAEFLADTRRNAVLIGPGADVGRRYRRGR